jgi:hypothetical protein
MGHFAFLAPVGPFAGLSNGVRQKISERFPALSIEEVESAAESFSTELRAAAMEPRLAEVRDELNTFGKEVARLQSALTPLRKHRLDGPIGEASLMIGGRNELEHLERSLGNLRTAIRQTARALPSGCPGLASRRLVAALAKRVDDTDSLLTLVDLIFEDLMVGGDAASAVSEWQRSRTAVIDSERVAALLELA